MYKNTRKNILYPLFLAIAIVAGIFIGMLFSRSGQQGAGGKMNNPGENKLTSALSLIEQIYVDPVDIDTLAETALSTVLQDLDPHSVYISASDYAAANEALDGEFDGVGIMFNMSTDTVIVLSVITSGPSDKAGVRNGDRIIMIDDSLVAGQKIGQDNIMKMLRGPRGTQVKLSLKRQGLEELVPLTVTRDVIPVKSLDAAFMLQPGIGFVKLTAFSKNSYVEMMSALEELKGQGMTGLILDLRENGGGFMEPALEIANELLPADRMIVYTQYGSKKRVEKFSDGKGRYADLPLVVLVDEGSASSSEILTGAIQDNDRGMVIGRRTFGKGLIQEQIPFGDSSAMRLTVARYYTPSGRSIQKPYDNGTEEYMKDLAVRRDHNEFFSADSIKFPDSLRFTTAGGRTVYGGGGIMPDIFVPVDTTMLSDYYFEVTGRNILYGYTIDYSDLHRAELDSITTIAGLDAFFDADKGLVDDFVKYADAKGVAPDRDDINHSRPLITSLLRAYIGRNTPLGDVGFYYNISGMDHVVRKAVGELQKENL